MSSCVLLWAELEEVGSGEQRPGMGLRLVVLLQPVISVAYYVQEEKGWKG